MYCTDDPGVHRHVPEAEGHQRGLLLQGSRHQQRRNHIPQRLQGETGKLQKVFQV